MKKLKQIATSVKARLAAVALNAKALPKRARAWRVEDLKKLRYRSFKLQKKIKAEPIFIPSSMELIKQTLRFMWRGKRVLFGIFLINLIAYLVFVRASIQPDVSTVQEALRSAVGDQSVTNGVRGNVITLGAVLGSSGSTQQSSSSAGVLFFIVSLAYIWAIRMLYNEQKVRARDAFYQGMTSLFPTLIVVGVVALQLLPFAFISFVYSLARSSGVFVTGFEDISFFTFTMLVGVLSGYLMTSSLMAVYASTLPGMYPTEALRSARMAVKHRRFAVFKRLIGMPLIVGAVYLVVLLLMIRVIPSQTFIFVELLQLLAIPFVHTYYYKLYRSLL